MKLSSTVMTQLLNTSIAAAYSAGAKIMRYFHSDVYKSDSKGRTDLAEDVVTQADTDAQEIILNFLLNLHPDIGILSEEEEVKNRSRFDKPYFWCVDPLDGTLPFLEKTSGFAVSIGLVSQAGEDHPFGPVLSQLPEA